MGPKEKKRSAGSSGASGFISFSDLSPTIAGAQSSSASVTAVVCPVYQGSDFDLGVICKKLLKKDLSSRFKATDDICQILNDENRAKGIAAEFIPYFIFTYVRLTIYDISAKVRENMNIILSKLAEYNRKSVRSFLSTFIGHLWMSLSDPSKEVSAAAYVALGALIPSKVKQKEILELSCASIMVSVKGVLQSKVESVMEQTMVNLDEARDVHERISSMALNSITEMLHRVYANTDTCDRLQDNKAIVSLNEMLQEEMWRKASSKRSLIRQECYKLLMAVCQLCPEVVPTTVNMQKFCQTVVLNLLRNSADIGDLKNTAISAFLVFVQTYSDFFFEAISIEKVFLPLLAELLVLEPNFVLEWLLPILAAVPPKYISLLSDIAPTADYISLLHCLFELTEGDKLSASLVEKTDIAIIEVSTLLLLRREVTVTNIDNECSDLTPEREIVIGEIVSYFCQSVVCVLSSGGPTAGDVRSRPPKQRSAVQSNANDAGNKSRDALCRSLAQFHKATEKNIVLSSSSWQVLFWDILSESISKLCQNRLLLNVWHASLKDTGDNAMTFVDVLNNAVLFDTYDNCQRFTLQLGLLFSTSMKLISSAPAAIDMTSTRVSNNGLYALLYLLKKKLLNYMEHTMTFTDEDRVFRELVLLQCVGYLTVGELSSDLTGHIQSVALTGTFVTTNVNTLKNRECGAYGGLIENSYIRQLLVQLDCSSHHSVSFSESISDNTMSSRWGQLLLQQVTSVLGDAARMSSAGQVHCLEDAQQIALDVIVRSNSIPCFQLFVAKHKYFLTAACSEELARWIQPSIDIIMGGAAAAHPGAGVTGAQYNALVKYWSTVGVPSHVHFLLSCCLVIFGSKCDASANRGSNLRDLVLQKALNPGSKANSKTIRWFMISYICTCVGYMRSSRIPDLKSPYCSDTASFLDLLLHIGVHGIRQLNRDTASEVGEGNTAAQVAQVTSCIFSSFLRCVNGQQIILQTFYGRLREPPLRQSSVFDSQSSSGLVVVHCWAGVRDCLLPHISNDDLLSELIEPVMKVLSLSLHTPNTASASIEDRHIDVSVEEDAVETIAKQMSWSKWSRHCCEALSLWCSRSIKETTTVTAKDILLAVGFCQDSVWRDIRMSDPDNSGALSQEYFLQCFLGFVDCWRENGSSALPSRLLFSQELLLEMTCCVVGECSDADPNLCSRALNSTSTNYNSMCNIVQNLSLNASDELSMLKIRLLDVLNDAVSMLEDQEKEALTVQCMQRLIECCQRSKPLSDVESKGNGCVSTACMLMFRLLCLPSPSEKDFSFGECSNAILENDCCAITHSVINVASPVPVWNEVKRSQQLLYVQKLTQDSPAVFSSGEVIATEVQYTAVPCTVLDVDNMDPKVPFYTVCFNQRGETKEVQTEAYRLLFEAPVWLSGGQSVDKWKADGAEGVEALGMEWLLQDTAVASTAGSNFVSEPNRVKYPTSSVRTYICNYITDLLLGLFSYTGTSNYLSKGQDSNASNMLNPLYVDAVCGVIIMMGRHPLKDEGVSFSKFGQVLQAVIVHLLSPNNIYNSLASVRVGHQLLSALLDSEGILYSAGDNRSRIGWFPVMIVRIFSQLVEKRKSCSRLLVTAKEYEDYLLLECLMCQRLLSCFHSHVLSLHLVDLLPAMLQHRGLYSLSVTASPSMNADMFLEVLRMAKCLWLFRHGDNVIKQKQLKLSKRKKTGSNSNSSGPSGVKSAAEIRLQTANDKNWEAVCLQIAFHVLCVEAEGFNCAIEMFQVLQLEAVNTVHWCIMTHCERNESFDMLDNALTKCSTSRKNAIVEQTLEDGVGENSTTEAEVCDSYDGDAKDALKSHLLCLVEDVGQIPAVRLGVSKILDILYSSSSCLTDSSDSTAAAAVPTGSQLSFEEQEELNDEKVFRTTVGDALFDSLSIKVAPFLPIRLSGSSSSAASCVSNSPSKRSSQASQARLTGLTAESYDHVGLWLTWILCLQRVNTASAMVITKETAAEEPVGATAGDIGVDQDVPSAKSHKGMCCASAPSVRASCASFLRKSHWFSAVMTTVLSKTSNMQKYSELPGAFQRMMVLTSGESSASDCTKLLYAMTLTSGVSVTQEMATAATSGQCDQLALYAFFRSICSLPALVRYWWDEVCIPKRKNSIQKFIESCVWESLMLHEIALIGKAFQSSPWDTSELQIKGSKSSGVITACYLRDDTSVEMTVTLSPSYPLKNAEVDISAKFIPENQWKRWKLQIIQLLGQQDGSVIDAILVWKSNVDKEFEGVEPCPICYSILHPKTRQMPTLVCKTCSNKFHSECLYTWFKSSGKSKCVICQQPFFD